MPLRGEGCCGVSGASRQFILIHGPNIAGSFAILFFVASDFTFISRHIHNCVLILLWSNHFILSGAISSRSPLFPSSISDTFQPEGTYLSVLYLFVFLYTVHEVLTASILGWFAIASSSGSCFVSILYYDLSVLGGPTQHGS